MSIIAALIVSFTLPVVFGYVVALVRGNLDFRLTKNEKKYV